jgi:hypothetical protein
LFALLACLVVTLACASPLRSPAQKTEDAIEAFRKELLGLWVLAEPDRGYQFLEFYEDDKVLGAYFGWETYGRYEILSEHSLLLKPEKRASEAEVLLSILELTDDTMKIKYADSEEEYVLQRAPAFKDLEELIVGGWDLTMEPTYGGSAQAATMIFGDDRQLVYCERDDETCDQVYKYTVVSQNTLKVAFEGDDIYLLVTQLTQQNLTLVTSGQPAQGNRLDATGIKPEKLLGYWSNVSGDKLEFTEKNVIDHSTGEILDYAMLTDKILAIEYGRDELVCYLVDLINGELTLTHAGTLEKITLVKQGR